MCLIDPHWRSRWGIGASVAALLSVITFLATGEAVARTKHVRELYFRNGEYYFVIRDSVTLGELSLRLYGTSKRWKKIAEWNELLPPYHVRIGQKLKLLEKPSLKRKQGEAELLAMWRKRFQDSSDFGATGVMLTPTEKKEYVKQQAIVVQQQRQDFAVAETEFEKERQEDLGKEELSAEQVMKEGEALFDQKKYEDAVKMFRKAREFNADALPPWFYEIRAWKLLENEDEAKKVAVELVGRRPELKALPMLKQLLAGAD